MKIFILIFVLLISSSIYSIGGGFGGGRSFSSGRFSSGRSSFSSRHSFNSFNRFNHSSRIKSRNSYYKNSSYSSYSHHGYDSSYTYLFIWLIVTSNNRVKAKTETISFPFPDFVFTALDGWIVKGCIVEESEE